MAGNVEVVLVDAANKAVIKIADITPTRILNVIPPKRLNVIAEERQIDMTPDKLGAIVPETPNAITPSRPKEEVDLSNDTNRIDWDEIERLSRSNICEDAEPFEEAIEAATKEIDKEKVVTAKREQTENEKPNEPVDAFEDAKLDIHYGIHPDKMFYQDNKLREGQHIAKLKEQRAKLDQLATYLHPQVMRGTRGRGGGRENLGRGAGLENKGRGVRGRGDRGRDSSERGGRGGGRGDRGRDSSGADDTDRGGGKGNTETFGEGCTMVHIVRMSNGRVVSKQACLFNN